MQSTRARLSAGGQYPYPREVWSPAGGWWTRPANWKSSSVLAAVGIAFATYGIWNLSSEKERRHVAPTKPIPSMLWAKEFTSGQLGVRDESALKGASAEHHEHH